MFSGIIENQATLLETIRNEAGLSFVLSTSLDMRDVEIGESIALNGVCLTLTSCKAQDNQFLLSFDIGPETLAVTTLGEYKTGQRLNLERAIRMGARNSGHLVQGHVDGIGHIVQRQEENGSLHLGIKSSPKLMEMCILKGSIALDGVSLTINQIHNDSFSVCLIPHTLASTNLGTLLQGDAVNIEIDMMGKYAHKKQSSIDETLRLEDFGKTPFERMQRAIEAFRAGKPIVLMDDANRENEADLVFAAEKSSPEQIAFMLRYTSGVICLCITEKWRQKLELPFMVQRNENAFQTAFTLSIEARSGITTGVSAADRNTTILSAISPAAKPQDLVCPGHVFPLCAKEGGVFTRRGHTEGSTDLARLAGLHESAVLCELMNDDGTMMRGALTFHFAQVHALAVLTIEDIALYRQQEGM